MSILAYTNEERINKLCECMIDLIYELQAYDRRFNERLEWVRNEVESIKKDTEKDF